MLGDFGTPTAYTVCNKHQVTFVLLGQRVALRMLQILAPLPAMLALWLDCRPESATYKVLLEMLNGTPPKISTFTKPLSITNLIPSIVTLACIKYLDGANFAEAEVVVPLQYLLIL